MRKWWTREQIKLLTDAIQAGTPIESISIPERTEWQIRRKLSSMRIPYPRKGQWTKEQIAMLAAGKPVPGRTRYAISAKAGVLGIRKPRNKRKPQVRLDELRAARILRIAEQVRAIRERTFAAIPQRPIADASTKP